VIRAPRTLRSALAVALLAVTAGCTAGRPCPPFESPDVLWLSERTWDVYRAPDHASRIPDVVFHTGPTYYPGGRLSDDGVLFPWIWIGEEGFEWEFENCTVAYSESPPEEQDPESEFVRFERD